MTQKNAIKGFGMMTLFALGLIVVSKEAGRSALLNDANGNATTDADKICNRNQKMVEMLAIDGGASI